jgi:hypothetical protein
VSTANCYRIRRADSHFRAWRVPTRMDSVAYLYVVSDSRPRGDQKLAVLLESTEGLQFGVSILAPLSVGRLFL